MKKINHPMNYLHPAALMFAIEGIFLQYNQSINGYSNSLFATALGATDINIGLVQMVPNLFACILMLPLGVLSDRMRSAKAVPVMTLVGMALGYFGIGTAPSLGSAKLLLYFFFLAFTTGGVAIYNSQWQAFFGEIIPEERRNEIYAFRNRFMFALGIVAPTTAGFLMNLSSAPSYRLSVLRGLYYMAGVLTLIQVFVLLRIPGGTRSDEIIEEQRQNGFHISEVAATIKTMMTNKEFLLFYFPVLFFHLAWHLDWSTWYIGQMQYVMLNETHLAVLSAVVSFGQLFSIGRMARLVYHKGADYTFIIAAIAMAMMPVVMVTSASMPLALRPAVFIVLCFIMNLPQCAINLCAVQMLLSVAPERNRSLVVSLYTISIALSNAFLPMTGAKIYTMLGSNTFAFRTFNGIVFVLRVIAVFILIWRYKYVRRENENRA